MVVFAEISASSHKLASKKAALLNEQDLIERLKDGDEAAFRELVTSWQDMVYNTALGIVQNELDAEDVAQEVFVKAFESIHGFKGESKVSTWLYRITVTRSLDYLRSRKRKKGLHLFTVFLARTMNWSSIRRTLTIRA